jgi:hypothetical protein
MQAYELLRLPHVVDAIINYGLMQSMEGTAVALHWLDSLTKAKSEHVALQASKLILDRTAARSSTSESRKSNDTFDVYIDLS